ncbi:MAG: hypothetical protein IMZ62_10740 [Chloroflexi bacterium]|nr:hypothetical protein [Chloroflexota bacterium]
MLKPGLLRPVLEPGLPRPVPEPGLLRPVLEPGLLRPVPEPGLLRPVPRARTGTIAGAGTTSLETMSKDQWLADLKRRMRMMTADLLRRPDLSDRERRRILAALKRLDLP